MSATVVSAYKTNCQLAPIKSHKAEIHSAKINNAESTLQQFIPLTNSFPDNFCVHFWAVLASCDN